jgi:tetratricopeptide (TPR) repeat protein
MRTEVYIFILALLSFTFDVYGTKLKGLITHYDSNRKFVKDAVIDAEGANRTTTNDLGKFELDFPHKQPGEKVVLVVKKTGLDVVNIEDCSTFLRKDPDEPVYISLCEAAKIQWIKTNNANLLSNTNTETYEKEISNLRKKLRDKEGDIRVLQDSIFLLKEKEHKVNSTTPTLANRITSVDPDYALDIYNRGYKLFLDNKPDEAVKLLEDTVLQKVLQESAGTQHKKNVFDAYVLKFSLLRAMGQFDSAERCLNILIDNGYEPQYWAYANRGEIRRLRGDNVKALNDFNTAIKLSSNPEPWIFASMGGAYFSLRDFTSAILFFTKALDAGYEPSGWAYSHRGEANRQLQRVDNALADLTEGINKNTPFMEWAYACRGGAYYTKGNYQRAIDDLSKAMELGYTQNLDWVLASRGTAYQMENDHQKAIADLTRAIKLNTKYCWAYERLAVSYRAIGDESLYEKTILQAKECK